MNKISLAPLPADGSKSRTPPSKSSSPRVHLLLGLNRSDGTGSPTRWMFFSHFFQDELHELVSTEPPDQYQLISLRILALGDTAHQDRAWRSAPVKMRRTKGEIRAASPSRGAAPADVHLAANLHETESARPLVHFKAVRQTICTKMGRVTVTPPIGLEAWSLALN